MSRLRRDVLRPGRGQARRQLPKVRPAGEGLRRLHPRDDRTVRRREPRARWTASPSSPSRTARRCRPARSSPRPSATTPDDANYHNNYQDPEAFLRAGGRRGRQYVPLTDGTYFINRWFATVEIIPKTVVPIGYVGVVVSYYGRAGRDVSGDAFRHGERVAEGERGVWERPLGPGKYPFNTYAGNIILVPTTNFVLHWITGKTESHRYDESLRSIDLVTKDAYEPMLPLSVVVHIDYQRAPERHPALRRREEADHADARPDAVGLLPRRGPQEDDAGAAAPARRDPAGGARGAAAASSASSTSSAWTCSSASRTRPRPAARSRRCWNSCGCGSCRSSRSRPTSASGRRRRSSRR